MANAAEVKGQEMSDKPPPAYSEIDTSPPFHMHAGGYPTQSYPTQSYPTQSYSQGYQHLEGQAKGSDVACAAFSPDQYPPGPQYPPGQQYPPAQYPAPPPPSGKPPFTPSQYPQYPPQGPFAHYPAYSPGTGPPPGAFPPGHYGQAPYGPPSATVVVTQPSGATVLVAQNLPPDNLMLSVLACLCCFCPLGMFAIMYSWQARMALDTHDLPAAQRYGVRARRFAIAAVVIGVLLFVAVVLTKMFVFTSDPYQYY